ncbi:unnamed protein product [Thlaspi arvense]|uniref:MADS-box domain-containing protein n=1 Tax=Thlaspi arvense TaxID=13288 RepID=A0AAU9RQ58_THLAR|nr:unnamed protein product [Thlaspi arvense]
MVGGTKTKCAMKKIVKKGSRAVAFSKRRKGLYSKASELCLLSSGAQVAILATPVSSNSNASFYSFGHSSVDSVVSAFLANQRPRENPNLWWEDESLAESESTKELTDAIDAISSMLEDLENHQALHRDQTLVLPSEPDREILTSPMADDIVGLDQEIDQFIDFETAFDDWLLETGSS